MTDDEFTAMIKRIKEYYDKPKYSTWDRRSMWYPKIKHIPTEAIPYIENCIYDNWNIPPANLPRHLRIYFLAWKSAYSNKIINYSKTQCQECGGKGLLWVQRPAIINGTVIKAAGIEMTETVSYRCAVCENWQRHCHFESKPSATKTQLLDKGWELL